MRTLAIFFLLALSLRADVALAPLFTDHAVLQRDKPLPIWGWAQPGEKVKVTFAGQTVSATTDENGKWLVVLQPIPVSAAGADLIVTGRNTVTASDLVVGDVWLCSGQSNMAFPVREAENAAAEISAANFPLIRQIALLASAQAAPTEKFSGNWLPANPANVGAFTAVGYFFARDIEPRLHVPIGLINCSVGGTEIETWIAASAYANDPALKDTHALWQKAHADWETAMARYRPELEAWTLQDNAARAHHQRNSVPKPSEPPMYGPKTEPSSYFNGMIAPLLPAALRGFLWYQAEANWYRPREYAAHFELLIRSWRTYFAQGDLPFFYVQLPNFKNGNGVGTDWAVLRDQQAAALFLPNTGMAVTIDLGNPDDIHPREKQEVGRRLALLARKEVYGMNVDDSGPVFESAERDGIAFRIHFTHAGTGLTAEDHPLFCFQIAGFDRKFYPASAKIQGETVIVSAREVTSPVAVRYAWFNDPSANLYNGAGLPAQPFRTDDW